MHTPAAELAVLGQAEQAVWSADLHWNTSDVWAALERSRGTGHVRGFVARRSSGEIAGWTYGVPTGQELQIGALVANAPATTAALLDAMLATPEAVLARRALFFAYTRAPHAEVCLRERGFDIGGEAYMVLPLRDRPAPASEPWRPWRAEDTDAAAELMAEAYGPDDTRAFVPDGNLEGWRTYVRQLTVAAGCGRFLPGLSLVVPGRAGLDAVAVTTQISDATVHLAQLAVRPSAGHAGLGRQLVTAVAAAAHAGSYARLSLLVGAANTRARRLYTGLGFTDAAAFLVATRSRRRDE